MTSPDVLPSVSYRSMRERQLSGVKPRGQCILALSRVATRARVEVATASFKAVGGLGSSGMVNTCESLLSAVSPNKPKMLTGLDQKVSDLISIGTVAMDSRSADDSVTGVKVRPTPLRDKRGTW